mmetsp:Transcript_55914/g.114268  ORF Transcript_55914/g.114268 Transcript_55914/m.114268 type:complete len:391 (+) Transcript_55914:5108-6280(+)
MLSGFLCDENLVLKDYDYYISRIFFLKKNLEFRIEEVKELRKSKKRIDKQLKQLTDTGLLVGEIIQKVGFDKFIIKAPTGTNYVVSASNNLNKTNLKEMTRIALDTSTLTIMKIIKKKIDPVINNMLKENSGQILYSDIGGLKKQLQQLKEITELPLFNKEIFKQIGVKIPKGVLLYGPPGTGKTLLAKSLSYNINAKFLKIVASSIVDKYIGESARIIREIFSFAKTNHPCIIFIDEIDAIGGKRFSEGSSADREIQRTLMELLNQLDGFEEMNDVKVIMATNRPDVLDPALLRPGRLDRKLLIPLPNPEGMLEIFKIYFKKMNKKGTINNEKIISLCKNFNGADLRNVCTEAGLFSIRSERDHVKEEDLIKAARKISESKQMEIGTSF